MSIYTGTRHLNYWVFVDNNSDLSAAIIFKDSGGT